MTTSEDLQFDLAKLVEVFGEPTSMSEPELLDYWFEYQREDGVKVILSLAGYERSVGIIVKVSDTVSAGYVRLESCEEIRVLEAERKTLEVLCPERRTRCLLALDGESILTVHTE